ncbi:MAG: C40 family peptidase [Pyrinomonadaceae bacterium]
MNKIEVVQSSQPLVTKTASSRPTAPAAANASKSAGFSAILRSRMLSSIQSKLGSPYRYGSTGPNTYDCSGLVWTVFNEIGVKFERSSARTFWSEFEPVEGDDRYRFGTLVFFNGLGHIGIVVDKKGFYHASSSKGVTYSQFEGYWEKRIVGFRRVPLEKLLYQPPSTDEKEK